jgi:hypothetical protein
VILPIPAPAPLPAPEPPPPTDLAPSVPPPAPQDLQTIFFTPASPASGLQTAGFGPPSGQPHGDTVQDVIATLPIPATTQSLDIHADQAFGVMLPWREASDFSGWTIVEMRSADGMPLPAWLHYDPVTGLLQGDPPVGFFGALQIEIVAADGQGYRVIGMVQLRFGDSQPATAGTAAHAHAKGDGPAHAHSHAPQRTHHAHPGTHKAANAAAAATFAGAKPGLDAQFGYHGRGAPVSAEAAQLLRQLHAAGPLARAPVSTVIASASN